jgi:hypothetical protein
MQADLSGDERKQDATVLPPTHWFKTVSARRLHSTRFIGRLSQPDCTHRVAAVAALRRRRRDTAAPAKQPTIAAMLTEAEPLFERAARDPLKCGPAR